METKYIENLPDEWEPIARIFFALGDKYRQTIMLLFEPNEELSLKSIVNALPLSRTAIVHHITTLLYSGLITSKKRGKEIYYKPNIKLFYQAVEITKEYMNPLLINQLNNEEII